MTNKANKSRSRHRTKKATVERRDCGVGTSKSLDKTDKAEQKQGTAVEENPRETLGISTRADFRAVAENVNTPLPRNCSETHLGFRPETPKDKDENDKHFLPEIVSNFKPLTWDDRLDEFCGDSTLDDVEYVRFAKRGMAFTQYVGNNRGFHIGNNRPSHIGNNRGSHLPRIFSDGAHQYMGQKKTYHLPRLISDGAIEKRGSAQQRNKTLKSVLSREQTVQHRCGGGYIENIRHASTPKRLEKEIQNIQKSSQHLREEHAYGTRGSVTNSADHAVPVQTSSKERHDQSTRTRVQETIQEQDRLRKQSHIRQMGNLMKKKH